jgi:uncharacterized protein YbjT (DUF2867 family)
LAKVEQVLLTGATGFIGRNLYPALRERGYRVICASRHPHEARERFPGREFRALDATDSASIEAALRGCQAALYLIHGMASGAGYETIEQRSAEAFRSAVERAGVSRVVYLGGIRPRGTPSHHLQSRAATGETLRAGTVTTIELRAAMVIGGGSEGWRIVRDLAARLPFMILPRWLDSESQPVAIADVTFALCEAIELPLAASAAYSLPGPEVISAREILMRTARLLGSNPRAVRVPIVSPRLSSYWIRLVTRADRNIAEQLVEGLRSDLIAEDDGFWRLVPQHVRESFDQAAKSALIEEQRGLSARSRAVESLIRAVSMPSTKHANRPSP